ncbi:Exodeoxyribonuclease III [Nocardia gamkensis]|nr:Exodeoxyribonuclease III [Nocardia gamkensis]
MTDSRAASKARNGVCIPVSSLFKGDSKVRGTESIRWRIDYQLARGGVATRAKDAEVERAAAYDQRWSDHAPVTVQYR